MKHKTIVFSLILFFLLVNTKGYWEGYLGLWAFPIFIALIVYYLVLIILTIKHIVISIKEKYSDKKRILIVASAIFLLFLTYFKPSGIIDYDALSGENLLVADREGAASCVSVLKFKQNNKFADKSICLSVDEIKGTYYKKGDTLFFKDVDLRKGEKKYDEFAVIKLFKVPNGIYLGKLISYKNKKDTLGYAYNITQNCFKMKILL